MDKWVGRKAETADAIIAAMTAGTCRTNKDVEAIAKSMNDTVRWYVEIDTQPPSEALFLKREKLWMKCAMKRRKVQEDEAAF